ncbi:MAG: adenine methyltransferase [Phycisphaerales bacterium]|nr:adenine methyltransferase [Phycisphaerales bacterium]
MDRLKVHFSSRVEDWSTPDDLFAELNSIFHFDLDACASPSNAKCPRFFTQDDDALRQRWTGRVWMNPPYGRKIAAFMEKAYGESLHGATVVCLVPSRTDTAWWHRFAKRGQIIFLRGRLKFGGAETSAPFPSAIVIFWGGRLGDAIRPTGHGKDTGLSFLDSED